MIHPDRWTSTLLPIRPLPKSAPRAVTGRRRSSGSSLPRCSNMAASAALRGRRACPAPARIGFAHACPAPNLIASGPMRSRCTPRGWPIPSRRRRPIAPRPAKPDETRRFTVASLSHRCCAIVAPASRRRRLMGASRAQHSGIGPKQADDGVNFTCRVANGTISPLSISVPDPHRVEP
jgi:hypothetical protein